MGLDEVRNALVEIDVPALLPADPLLLVEYRVRRAVHHATLAADAKIVHGNIHRLVKFQRQVGEHRRQAKVGSVLLADHGAVLAQLAQPRRNGQGYMEDVGAVGIAVGTRGPPLAANESGYSQGDAGNPPVRTHYLNGRRIVRDMGHLLLVHGKPDADGRAMRRRTACKDRLVSDRRNPHQVRSEIAGSILDPTAHFRRVRFDPALRHRSIALAQLPGIGHHVAHDAPRIDGAEEVIQRLPFQLRVARVVENGGGGTPLPLAQAVDLIAGAWWVPVCEGIFRRRRVLGLNALNCFAHPRSPPALSTQ